MTINTANCQPVHSPAWGRGGAAAPAYLERRDAAPPRALSRSDAQRRFGSSGLRRALDTRAWVELWPGVVVRGPDLHDRVTRSAAALLRAGPCAVLSAGTAVAMHGCTAADALVVEVTVPYDRQLRSRPGLVVHQSHVAESDVVELDGLRTHALDVALTELLCRGGSQHRALACLHQAMAQADAVERDSRGAGHGAESLRAMVAERVARRRDRRGTRRAAAVLELARDPAVSHAEYAITGTEVS